MKTQRDVFLDHLFEKAKIDKNIVLLSVDMGAPSLDKWRVELPNQFFSMGISEQNAINVAAGLSRGGKKVFVYFMAVWVLRCFEQIRYSCAIAKNPITIIGNGVSLGYAPAGPAHEPNEDVAVMKTLLGINIWSPWNIEKISDIVNTCLTNDELNYVRLERSAQYFELNKMLFLNKYSSIDFDVYSKSTENEENIFIFTYSYMVNKCFNILEKYNGESNLTIIVLNKLFPMNLELLNFLDKSKVNNIITIEEQTLLGSFSESLVLFLIKNGYKIKLKTFNLNNRYIMENGSRDLLLELNGLNMDKILNAVYDLN